MKRSCIIANRTHGHLRILFFFPLLCCLSFTSSSQTKTQTFDEEWQELGRRLECVMTGAAQRISNNYSLSCHRDYDFASNAIGWEWSSYNDEGTEYSSWIRAAVFANESDANAWWEDRSLHLYHYDNSIEAAKFWDYKRLVSFQGNVAVVKVRGFDADGYRVEGTYWWKKGRFVFQAGLVARNTEAELIQALENDHDKIFTETSSCNLFNAISLDVHHFDFDVEDNTVFYKCNSIKSFQAHAMNESGEKVNLNDDVTVKYFHDNIELESVQETVDLGDLDIYLPWVEEALENVSVQISYLDITSESAKFNIRHTWQIHMDSYPDEIEYNETIILSGIVEDLVPPFQLFNEEILFVLRSVWTRWEYDCSETPGSFSTSFTAPSKEIAGNQPNAVIDLTLYPCYLNSSEANIQVTIPYANFIPDPDEGFSNAKSFGGTGADKGIDILINPPYEFLEDPNITTGYAIGDFTEVIEFDDLDLEAPFNSALYLTKLEMDENDNMVAVWGEVIGSTGYTETLAKSVTPRTVQDRGVSVLSISGGAIKLGDVTVPRSEGGAFVVVASLDKYGRVLSSTVSNKLSPGQARHNANELVIDDYGSTLILGDFYEDILFHKSGEPGTKTGNNSGDWKGNGDGNMYSQDLFLVKYDENGNLLWGFEANSNADPTYMPYVRGTAMAVDENNNIYVAGEYGAGLTIGTTTMTTYGGFIIKLDSDGNIIWAQNMFGESFFPVIEITAMCTDHNGALYITGVAFPHTSFSGLMWDGWSGLYNDGRRVFIAKYNTEGEPQWVDFATIEDYSVVQHCNDMEIDSGGNIYITGRFNMGPIAFGEQELVPQSSLNGNWIIFVASYNSNGEALWAQMAGDEENITPGYDFDDGKGLSIDANDNCYLTGSFSGSIVFGEDTLTSKGGPDAFMVKISGPASTSAEEITVPEPSKMISLAQNYPNPFSESTIISYTLHAPGLVTIRVYDLLGNMVRELISEDQAVGEYSHTVNLASLTAGVYFYQIRSGSEQHTRKMIIR